MIPKIVPFVDHEIGYRLLQKLVLCSAAGSIEIPAVVTTCENRNAWWPSIDEICIKAKIPILVYEAQFPEDCLIKHRPDWILLLSWKHIIPARILSLPRVGMLNLHYSMLPAFRGVYPVNWAIINGERTTGFTYHFVNERIDDGEIFIQIEVPIYLSDTARTLHLRLDDAVCNHFDDFIERLLSYNKKNQAKVSCHKSVVSSDYFSRLYFEKACLIDLNRSYRGIEFFNLLRGMSFFEDSRNAYVLDRETGKKIFITLILS